VNQENRVSLLMLNWQRQENLTRILDAQADYDCINEIIIFNNNTSINFKHVHSKVKILNASFDFGLRSRWVLAALADNKHLVFQDDDILLPENVFEEFIKEILLDGERAYSLHGRNPNDNCEYSMRQVKNEAEMVLTRATCVNKAVIPLILHQENRFHQAGFTLPPLNGEDIFLSYCLTAHFGKRHKILDLPFQELPEPHALWRKSGHLKTRTEVLQKCKRFFFPSGYPNTVRPINKTNELFDLKKRPIKGNSPRVCLRAPINAYTGYGLHAIQIVYDLVQSGFNVNLIPIGVSNRFAPVPDFVRNKVVSRHDGNWELLLYPPTRAVTPGKRTIYFTMWESTNLPPNAVNYLNQAKCVIVPCRWNVDLFLAEGVKTPIYQIPLGINTAVFKNAPISLVSPCVFGTGGRMASGGVRKGVGQVMSAFLQAFPSESDVRLYIKVFPDCEIPCTNDPRIVITRKFLSEQEMANWYCSLTCFVSAARGEGWGLMQHQALATGRPVISIVYGGVKEFFNREVGYPLDYKLVPAEKLYAGCGSWAEPVQESLIENMRRVYRDREEAAKLGERGSQRASQFPWHRSNQELIKVLKQCGVLR
jgi:glycosyltransferase involved in cell wall biosynthesis